MQSEVRLNKYGSVFSQMSLGAPEAEGALGAPATPAGVRVIVPFLPGGSLRSPPANFLSPRWGGIRYCIYET